MNKEYQEKARKIKRKNHTLFGSIVGGLAALAIGTKIYISNPNIPLEKRENVREMVYNFSFLGVMAGSFGFTIKELKQLRKLEKEYNISEEED